MECALSNGYTSVHFESDCMGIVKLIEEPDDWITFFTELDSFQCMRERFLMFSFAYIPRINNVHADRLAKSARARIFEFSHVSSQVPEWLASIRTSLIIYGAFAVKKKIQHALNGFEFR